MGAGSGATARRRPSVSGPARNRSKSQRGLRWAGQPSPRERPTPAARAADQVVASTSGAVAARARGDGGDGGKESRPGSRARRDSAPRKTRPRRGARRGGARRRGPRRPRAGQPTKMRRRPGRTRAKSRRTSWRSDSVRWAMSVSAVIVAAREAAASRTMSGQSTRSRVRKHLPGCGAAQRGDRGQRSAPAPRGTLANAAVGGERVQCVVDLAAGEAGASGREVSRRRGRLRDRRSQGDVHGYP